MKHTSHLSFEVYFREATPPEIAEDDQEKVVAYFSDASSIYTRGKTRLAALHKLRKRIIDIVREPYACGERTPRGPS